MNVRVSLQLKPKPPNAVRVYYEGNKFVTVAQFHGRTPALRLRQQLCHMTDNELVAWMASKGFSVPRPLPFAWEEVAAS